MTVWKPVETAPKDGTLILIHDEPELMHAMLLGWLQMADVGLRGIYDRHRYARMGSLSGMMNKPEILFAILADAIALRSPGRRGASD